jgi:hypothetical protein
VALSSENVQALCAPFAYEDHEFTRGFAYITEQAITRRLDSVDPSWDFIIIETVRDATSASATGRLTVCRVERDGVGTQSIEYSSNTDKTTGEKKPALDAAGNPREAGEVRKGAATDALKRAARLFGVGRYILDAPPLRMASSSFGETKLDQASEKAFRAYLAKCGAPAQQPANPFGGLPSIEPPPPADNEPLSPDAVRSLVLEGKRNGMTDAQVLAALGCNAKWSEYTGTMSQARETVRKAAAALKAANGAAMPDDAFGGAK